MPENKESLNTGYETTKPETTVNNTEDTYKGIGASKGIAIGECYTFVREESDYEITELNDQNINEEIQRFLSALHRSENELKKIEQVTKKSLERGIPICLRLRS